jgi:SAM-dependent methyltransferase
MDATDWDERYAAGQVWSVEPNGWLVDAVGDLPPGRALDLACGEGRNAVWLHGRGWEVTAVDFSQVGLSKGRAAAPEVRWVCADVTTWEPPGAAFDLVALVYLHLPPLAWRTVLARAVAAVGPGGSLVVIGHDVRNLAEGVGGPQDPAILLDPAAIADAVGELHVERAGTVERAVDGGTALDALVVARRP